MKRIFKTSKIRYNFKNNKTIATVEIDFLSRKYKDLEKSKLLACYYDFTSNYIEKLCKTFNLKYNESQLTTVAVSTKCTDKDNYDKAIGIYIASRKLELKLNKIDLYIKKDIYKFINKINNEYYKEISDKEEKIFVAKHILNFDKNNISCLTVDNKINKIRNSMKDDSSNSN